MPEGVKMRLLELRGLPVSALIDFVHRHGGILGPAHPCGEKYLSFTNTKKFYKSPEIIKRFDFIEAFNACEPEESNREAMKLTMKYKKPGIGGSDAHKLDCVSLAYTELPERITCETELISLIRRKAPIGVGGTIYGKTTKDKIGKVNKLLVYSFCMGGALLFLIRTFPGFRAALTGVCGILGAGGILCLFLSRICRRRRQEDSVCRATLIRGDKRAAVNALIDSGNSLTEPFSGSPVSVVEEDVFRKLWGDSVQGCRVIPYHSIGKRRGILMGYLLPELRLEVDGLEKTFRKVYIAVSKEAIASDSAEAEAVKMIINPRLLEEAGKGKQPKRQNERTYDSESSDTGKNAV